jgi:hypothetical protein
MPTGQAEPNSRNAFFPILLGIAFGAFVEVPALFVAIISAGAGHGDYVAARILFPFSMLLTLVEGSIGTLAAITGLLQFPAYGALLGWSIWRESYGAIIVVASLHVAAAVICFAGVLPGFS